MLSINHRTRKLTPAPDDVRVSPALNYAVDRPVLAKAILGPYGKPVSALEPIGSGADPKVASYYSYDPAKAKALLAQAGYPHGFTMKLLSFSTFDTAVRAIAQELQAVGVTVDIKSETDPQSWFTAALSKQYDSYITQDLLGPVNAYWTSYFSPAGAFNPFALNDPTVTKLYSEGAASSDPQQDWAQMTDYITQQAYVLPIATAPSFVYYKNIGGVDPAQPRIGLAPVAEWYPTQGS